MDGLGSRGLCVSTIIVFCAAIFRNASFGGGAIGRIRASCACYGSRMTSVRVYSWLS